MRCFYFVSAILVAVSAACSVLIDHEVTQCVQDADCTSRGMAFAETQCVAGYCEAKPLVEEPTKCTKDEQCSADELCLNDKCVGRWACVEDSVEPSMTNSGAVPMVSLDIPVQNLGAVRLPGVKAKLCRTLDPACDMPVAALVSDAAGVFHVNVPTGATGYFLDLQEQTYFPQLYFLPAPVRNGGELAGISLSPTAVISGLGLAVGAALDPERGQVLVNVKACAGTASGVELKAGRADGMSIPFYILDGVPSADLTATTDNGSGGFLNFPPGNATIVLVSAGQRELRTVSLIVRRGAISTVTFNPNVK